MKKLTLILSVLALAAVAPVYAGTCGGCTGGEKKAETEKKESAEKSAEAPKTAESEKKS